MWLHNRATDSYDCVDKGKSFGSQQRGPIFK